MEKLFVDFILVFFISAIFTIWIYTNSNISVNAPSFLTLYQIMKDVFSGTFIVITATIAYKGLNIWKKEQALKEKRAISVGLLTDLGLVLNEINKMRQSDLIFEQEIRDSIKSVGLNLNSEISENEQYAAVLTNRWNNLKEFFLTINRSKIQAKIIFGEEVDIEKTFHDFEKTVSKIGSAMQYTVTYHCSKAMIPIDRKEFIKNQELIYSSWNIEKNGIDIVKNELDEGYNKINKELNPFIELK